MNISGGGDDTDDTDDLPVFGSFGSYSPQYKRQNPGATQLNATDTTAEDMFLLNDSMCTQSSTSSIGSFNSTKSSDSGAIPKIQTPQLRKLDVSIILMFLTKMQKNKKSRMLQSILNISDVQRSQNKAYQNTC